MCLTFIFFIDDLSHPYINKQIFHHPISVKTIQNFWRVTLGV